MSAGVEALILVGILGVGGLVVYELYVKNKTTTPASNTTAPNTANSSTNSSVDSAAGLTNALAGLASEFNLAGLV